MVCLGRLGLETLLVAAAPCCLLGKWAPGTAGGLLAPELSYSEQQRKLHPASIFSFLFHMLVNFSFELNVGPTFKACQLKRCQSFFLPARGAYTSQSSSDSVSHTGPKTTKVWLFLLPGYVQYSLMGFHLEWNQRMCFPYSFGSREATWPCGSPHILWQQFSFYSWAHS